MLTVTPIHAYIDNYIWAISRQDSPYCLVVDPGDAAPVQAYLKAEQLELAAILITHHHADHTGGLNSLLKTTAVPVYGPAQETIPQLTHPLKGGETIDIAELDIQFTILAIPGHTKGHIAYYSEACLFCGDTLFAGGCGRIFEGTPAQLYSSLEKIAKLPDDTHIYCAHEYTLMNLKFALNVEPDNQKLQQRYKNVQTLREQHKTSLPSTLQEEKLTNPFLRSTETAVINAASHYAGKPLHHPVDVFSTVRQWKDHF